MACHAGPKVSESGLVLALDAANSAITLSTVEVLVVAGGGGGGGGTAGGGGAGGLIYNSNFTVTPGSALTVTVGAGGTGKVYSVSNTAGDNGGNSVFGSLTAIGGGGGGNRDTVEVGKNGGSGGGGGGDDVGVNSAGTGTSGQGFAGGTGRGGGGYSAGGGGGGAGASGQASPSISLGGNGGDGLGFNISGTFAYYGGGGGGGSHSGKSSGGIGGGGAGGSIYSDNAVAGTTNTGGGGGGGAGGAGIVAGKNGGSGIVIVRYPGPQKAIGGTVTSRGGYTIHTFTSVGSTTFTPLSTSNGSAISGLTDISNNGNFGTPVNGPTYSSANGGSIAFDGVDDYVNAGNLGSFYSQGTISYWMNSSAVEDYRNPLSTHYLGYNVGIRFEQYSSPSPYGGFNVLVGNDTGTYVLYDYSPGAILTANIWYNVVLVWNTSTNNVVGYLNGTQKFNYTTHTYWATTLPSISIGSGFNASRYFKGNIATTQIYNRALSAAEIQQNFNATRGRFNI